MVESARAAPLTVVFILSTRRAGSTWLNAVLGSHSWATSLGEYCRPFFDRSHVACRLCEADGVANCPVLHGIERVPQRDAFDFAAQRTGRRVLIDASKRLDWALEFVGRDDIDVRLLHLVRHPCGYVESEGRRNATATPEALLDNWVRANRDIERFIAASGRRATAVSYDALAAEPQRMFPPMCHWLDRAWEPRALAYWESPNHGLGANGASSLYLRARANKRYVTGDDAYYDALFAARRTAADDRWRERLPRDFCRRAIASPYAAALAGRVGVGAWASP